MARLPLRASLRSGANLIDLQFKENVRVWTKARRQENIGWRRSQPGPAAVLEATFLAAVLCACVLTLKRGKIPAPGSIPARFIISQR
ncbi:MAG TPA: hypothetical protein VMI47_06355 [Pseudolabrys sp.]|nr:hypothetical protein [Pseudolabrys sp.]